jgi:electron transport complex protein RnfG
MIKLCIVLGVVCTLSGLALGLVYQVTERPIEEAARRALERSLGVVLPRAARFSAERVTPCAGGGEAVYYEGYASDGALVGYALMGGKQGYQSYIKVLVGIDPAGVIQGIDVLQQAETPGLGARIEEVAARETLWGRLHQVFAGEAPPSSPGRPWFGQQFDGRTIDRLTLIVPPRQGDGIHALTGATITSRALTDAVEESIERFLSTRRGGADSDGG